MYSALRALTLFYVLNCSLSALAAEIYSKPWYGRRVHTYLVGPIVSGDDDKFKAEVLAQLRKGNLVSALQLYTPGGHVEAAMSIGEQVRVLQIQTYTPERVWQNGTFEATESGEHYCRYGALDREEKRNDASCTCQSACFIIWAAGIDRRGDYIGIHHPYFNSKFFSGLTPKDARETYEKMANRVRAYFNKLSVPESILNRMWRTMADEMYFLNKDEVDSLRNPDAWRDQYLRDKCGSIPRDGTVFTNRDRKNAVDCQSEVYEAIYAEAAQKFLELYGKAGEEVPNTRFEPVRTSTPSAPSTPQPKVVIRTTPDAPPAPNLPPARRPEPITVPPTSSDRVVHTDGPNADYLIRNNRDLNGDDLRPFLPKVSQNLCAQECTKNLFCQGFSFDEWNHLCILKTNLRDSRLEPRSISGVKRGQFSRFPLTSSTAAQMKKFSNKYFPGEGYQTTTENSTDDCERVCHADMSCVAYTYLKTPSTCRLFKSTGQYFSSPSADAGIKTQP